MGTVYVLRCNAPNMTSYGGFVWPESGPVEAPDWSPEPECGRGLHGWLWGGGDVGCSGYHEDPEARWLVVRVESAAIVDLGGKVKFPRGEVVFCGTRDAAVAEIVRLGAHGAIIYGTATAGDYGTATAGDRGTATAGDYGTATAGDRGTATAGDYGTATAGDYGTATAGDRGELRLRWHDGSRYRCAVAYVGEDDIEPGVAYRLDDRGNFVRAEKAQ